MDMMTNILWIVAIWWMFSRMFKAMKIIQYQKILREQEESKINHAKEEPEIHKQHKEAALEMVEDACCGKYIEKSQAYQLIQGATTHYFCSWDCREKYIKEH